jgi:dTMP kinase
MTNFIVLEGIDGSGTSTQAELLKNYLISQQQKAVVTSEPSQGKIGQLLRELLVQKDLFDSPAKFDEQMAYLFAADRYYHLYNNQDGVWKLINEQTHVISTRYYFSSLAYNTKAPEDFNFVWSLNQKFPPPNLVIYIDISVELAIERISDRPCKEIYETQSKLEKVKENFEHIFANYDGQILRVDGSKSKEQIHQNIRNYLEKMKSF